jgi:hypothetical protein
VQVDETPIRDLEPGHGKTRQGYLWTCHRPGGDAIYHWQTSRAAACLDRIVPVDFKGVLQSDGYAAYGAFARERGKAITLAGCWAHARRGFHEALQCAPRDAVLLLHQIGNLYAIERRRHPRRAAPGRRCGLSRAKSKADPSSNDSVPRCGAGNCATATFRKAPWVKPSTTPWASGPR